MTIDFEADAQVEQSPKTEDVGAAGRVAELVKELKKINGNIVELKEQLDALEQDAKEITEKQIPQLFEEYGLSEIKLSDGSRVKVEDKYFAGITKENETLAFHWLRDHGHDDIIKNDVTVTFGKGQDDLAEQVMERLQNMGMGQYMKNRKHVHWQTLRAFVKEQVKEGANLPFDLFGVHIVPTAEVK
jgi:hypothetical protein